MSLPLTAMLLCASVAPVVRGIDSRHADSRIDLKVSYTEEGVELELTNKASSPIVAWAFSFGPKWRDAPSPMGDSLRGANRRADRFRSRQACAGASGRIELIEPSETRRFTANPPRNCPGAGVPRVSAIFADGTWTGEWTDFELTVKLLTIRRLVLQRWLTSLHALEKADDPLELLGRQMDELSNVPVTYRISGFGTKQLRKVDEIRAQSTLRTYVKRCYDNVLLSVYRSNGDQKWGRDKRAEKQLRSRGDARQRIAEGIAGEIEKVSNELDDLAWVTMFGPNGERIGPEVPPPPPKKRQRERKLITRQ